MENSLQNLDTKTPLPTEMVFGLEATDSAAHDRLAEAAFAALKRGFDITCALVAMPLILIFALILTVVNPLWNAGPVFYRQKRMGRNCRCFTVLKFRSMRPAGQVARGPDDVLEHDRITPLGRFIRVTRIDELPQFINVLNGDMSVIGPRPDYWNHAVHYIASIPEYRARHSVRPGITGLAQVDAGYAEGMAATFAKVRHDLRYIRQLGLRMELYVFCRTIYVVLSGSGAR